jgi:hypothetical protein
MKERETSDSHSESQRDTIARLEKEIAFLQRKYEQGLQQSWAEVERIEHESHLKDVKVEEIENACMDLEERCNRLEEMCEQQAVELVEARRIPPISVTPPVQKLPRRCSMPTVSSATLTSFFQHKTLMPPRISSYHDLTVLTEDASTQQVSIQQTQWRNQTSERPLIQKQGQWAERFGAFASKEENKHERDLLRQLSVLQDEWTREVLELKLKLNQREAAIETLERALILKEECVDELRTEMASMTSDMLAAYSRPSNRSPDCGSDSSTRVTDSTGSNSSKKTSKACAIRRRSSAGGAASRRNSYTSTSNTRRRSGSPTTQNGFE